MITIRRAEHHDALDIIETHVKSIRVLCAKDYSPAQIEAWAGRPFKTELWRQAMDRDFIWVVESGQKVQGFGHLALMDADTCELMGLYVSPELYGRGSAKELMKIILAQAKLLGAKKIQLHSTLTARTFYERYLFHQVEGKCSVDMRGVDVPCYPMERLL